MSNDALIPVEQKVVDFRGDSVIAVRMEDGTIYVPIKPICEVLTLNWSGQRQRIQRDNVLSEVVGECVIHSPKGGKQSMLVLPLEYLSGWLFKISTSRIKDPDVREAVEQYQRDCYRVLFEAFGQNTVTARPDDELMQSDDPIAVIYRQSLAIAKLARESYHHTRQLDNHEQRLQLIEANLGNDKRYVTKEQASHISQGVRAIGTVLSKRSSKNEYGGVYGELYRTWSVSSYKEIPAVKYDDVITWLKNWYLELVDDSDAPF